MKEVFDRLSRIQGGVCVTIILNTHKTTPDNQKDSIVLKNMISEAATRLENEYDHKIAKSYTEKLTQLANEIDHYHNDNGMMLFVNENIAEYLRIPTHPEPRVIIDDTFATRSIVRAMKKDTDYYVLVLTKGRARLIEASSEDVVEEVRNKEFPVKDNNSVSLSKEEAAKSQRMTNILDEFFNRVDKSINRVRTNNPLPIFICSEENNYHLYLKSADYPDTIKGHLTLRNFDEKPANLIKEIWPVVRDLTVENNRTRIAELNQAVSTGTCITDINEIWNAVKEARGKTIFVEEGYYQAAKNDDGFLTPIEASEISHRNDIDDVVDDMIEYTLKYGGDVVFLEKDSMKDFDKLALVTRY